MRYIPFIITFSISAAFLTMANYSRHYADMRAAAAVGLTPESASHYSAEPDRMAHVPSQKAAKALMEVWHITDAELDKQMNIFGE